MGRQHGGMARPPAPPAASSPTTRPRATSPRAPSWSISPAPSGSPPTSSSASPRSRKDHPEDRPPPQAAPEGRRPPPRRSAHRPQSPRRPPRVPPAHRPPRPARLVLTRVLLPRASAGQRTARTPPLARKIALAPPPTHDRRAGLSISQARRSVVPNSDHCEAASARRRSASSRNSARMPACVPPRSATVG